MPHLKEVASQQGGRLQSLMRILGKCQRDEHKKLFFWSGGGSPSLWGRLLNIQSPKWSKTEGVAFPKPLGWAFSSKISDGWICNVALHRCFQGEFGTACFTGARPLPQGRREDPPALGGLDLTTWWVLKGSPQAVLSFLQGQPVDLPIWDLPRTLWISLVWAGPLPIRTAQTLLGLVILLYFQTEVTT